MASKKHGLEARLPDICDELCEAEQFFSVWRAFTDPQNRASFEPTMERFCQFFDSIVRAHFTALIVTLYRVYERGPKVDTLRQLHEDAQSQNLLKSTAKSEAANIHSSVEATWRKVSIVRSNVYGHKSTKLSPELAFEKAKLTPNEIWNMIDLCQRLFNLIAKALTGTTHTFNVNATEDVHNLMTRLARNAL